MKRHRLAVHLVIVLLLLTGCKYSQLQKAAKASDDMAVSISLAIDAKRALALSNPPVITPQEELTLTLALGKVNSAVSEFRLKAMTLKQIDANGKTELLPLFTAISQAVTELNNQGVLGIKNPEAKQKISLILSSLTAAMAVIQSVLGGV